ncbi:rRNA maturation RNase YbeY [Candidatus Palauibacter sp.]|uniref:rRNA maturation RNase YbeY n=1 Tax=Candidatus Palauibacter sp. TaxID=3101350 RepID=UPI003B5A2938
MTRPEASRPTIRLSLPPEWDGPPEPALEAAARATLGRGRAPTQDAELSITLVSAESIRVLNRDYHGVDDVTDVLAFGLGEDPLLGDVYICPEVAEASARQLGLDPDEEILRLVIHGILHLLGHTHPEGEARYASPMFELQERLLAEVRDRT